MANQQESGLRNIPSVDLLLRQDRIAPLVAQTGRSIVTGILRLVLDDLRRDIAAGSLEAASRDELTSTAVAMAVERLADTSKPYYARVVNATGIILHTGLGRAVLPERALGQIADHLSGYSLLQLGVETGKRSRREERIEELLTRLTGAEAATIVNNNAAATMLVLSAIGSGKEIIVSLSLIHI